MVIGEVFNKISLEPAAALKPNNDTVGWAFGTPRLGRVDMITYGGTTYHDQGCEVARLFPSPWFPCSGPLGFLLSMQEALVQRSRNSSVNETSVRLLDIVRTANLG